MAVWFIDGFDYTTGSATPGSTFYTSDVGMDIGTSRWSTNCGFVANSVANFISQGYGPGGSRVAGAIAFKADGGSTSSLFFGFINRSTPGTSAAYIGTNGGNNITVTNWKGNGGIFGRSQAVTLSVDAGFPVANGQWHWLEFDLDWATTGTPTQKLSLDQNVIYNSAFNINGSGGETPNIEAIDFGMYYVASETVYVDDVILYDDTDDGTPGCITYANWPLGLKQFSTIRPTGDVTSDFTPLSGTDNFAMVDEPDLDGNTTYNYANAPASGTRDLYSYSNLSFLPLSILTVAVIDAWQNAGGGSAEMKALAKSAGVEMLQSSHYLGAGYATQIDMFYNDPSGNPWTGTTINGANFGYETV